MSLNPTSDPWNRRQFVRHFALGSALSLVAGQPWNARLLADVTPSGEPLGRFTLKLSDYPPLANTGGSLQFAFTTTINPYYPFMINRLPGGTFLALSTRCTHEGCAVNSYNLATSQILCSCHGSTYDLQGHVTGGPAAQNLDRYVTNFDGNDTLTVDIPGLDFQVRTVSIQSRTESSIRLRILFPAVLNAKYKLYYRANLTDTPQPVMFSLTATGVANQTQVTATAPTRTVYVDATGTRGFYSVAILATEYP